MTDHTYKICSNCIMDTSDPEIRFDEHGVCNYCRDFERIKARFWFPNAEGAQRLAVMVTEIKRVGTAKEYDCILGLSGGVDSSYLLIKAVELGLRPLVVHVDAGWNSELAVNNIENLVKRLGLDLHTYVVDWLEMRELQIAYLKSGVANQDVPQDHAFFAQLLKVAAQYKIRYVLIGTNYASESILPKAWGYNAMDARNLQAIHRVHGSLRLKTYPLVSYLDWSVYYPYVARIRYIKPLNFIPYEKLTAKKLLEEQYGWRDYGGKHYESRFTKFFQGYYLVNRYGYDKRRAHLASLIVSGQMTREAALAEMEKEPYPMAEFAEDRLFICKKLSITEQDLEKYLSAPLRLATDYPSNARIFENEWRFRAWLGRSKRRLMWVAGIGQKPRIDDSRAVQ